MMDINISAQQLLKKLIYVQVSLLILNSIAIIVKLYFGYDHVHGLIPFFDFNSENNLPTYFSTMILLVSSCLLTYIALTHKHSQNSYLPWIGLAFIFLFLSIDEMVSLHERLSNPMREIFNASGFFYFTWVIPYGLALTFFLIVYIKFLRALPKKIMTLFLISGTTFVTGAMGLEIIGGNYFELHGQNNLIYSLLYTCEETLEMLGIIIFIYTLLTYMNILSKEIKITFDRN